jgi:parvulin-like peptidyl-prolyl isomerase
MAQKPRGVTKQELDKAIAEKGAKLVLYSDKDLLEANESCVLSIRYSIT